MPRGENSAPGHQGFMHTTPIPVDPPTPNPAADTPVAPSDHTSAPTIEQLADVVASLTNTDQTETYADLVARYADANPANMDNDTLITAFRELTAERKIIRERRDNVRSWAVALGADPNVLVTTDYEAAYVAISRVWRPIARERYERRLNGTNGTKFALEILTGQTKVTAETRDKAYAKLHGELADELAAAIDPAPWITSDDNPDCRLIINTDGDEHYVTFTYAPCANSEREAQAIKNVLTRWSATVEYPQTVNVFMQDEYGVGWEAYLKIDRTTWETKISTYAGDLTSSDPTLAHAIAQAEALSRRD